MTTDTTSAYLRNKVFSATPAELRLMLLDGALRFCRLGREGLVAKNFEQSFNGFSNAKNILMELATSLRDEIDPDLCAKLRGLYMFLYKRLVDANLEKSPAIVDEVISLLEFERETWVMLMQKLASQGAEQPAQAASAPAAPAPARTAPPAPSPKSGERKAISVEA